MTAVGARGLALAKWAADFAGSWGSRPPTVFANEDAMIIKDEVRKLLDRNWSIEAISKRLGITKHNVRVVRYRLNNPEWIADYQRKYGAARYGTPEYRKWDRERKQHKYRVDPFFRQARIDAVKRYQAKQKSKEKQA